MNSTLTKPLRLLTTKLVVALGAVLLWPSAAQADTDIDFSIRTPVLSISSYSNQRYSHPRRYRHSGRYSQRHQNRRYHRGYRNHGYRNRGYRNNSYYYQRAPRFNTAPRFYSGLQLGGSRGCRNVTKEGYWDGYPALIGGRECYDRFGRAYISPNSRHLIRYR